MKIQQVKTELSCSMQRRQTDRHDEAAHNSVTVTNKAEIM